MIPKETKTACDDYTMTVEVRFYSAKVRTLFPIQSALIFVKVLCKCKALSPYDPFQFLRRHG